MVVDDIKNLITWIMLILQVKEQFFITSAKLKYEITNERYLPRRCICRSFNFFTYNEL